MNGINLYYEEIGEGPAFVFIHGFTGDKWSWLFQLPAFSEFFRVIIPDLRGHGRSDKPREECTVPKLASDINSFLKKLNVDKAVIAGLSLGGMVAMQFALDYPNRVRALILADTASSLANEKARRMIEDWIVAFRQPGGLPNWYQERLPLLLNDAFINSDLGRDMIEGRKDRLERADAEALIAVAKGMMNFHATDRLGEIKAPTLVVVGDEDPITPVSLSEEIHAKIPGSKYSLILGSRHVSNADNALAFNRIVLDFLKKQGLTGK